MLTLCITFEFLSDSVFWFSLIMSASRLFGILSTPFMERVMVLIGGAMLGALVVPEMVMYSEDLFSNVSSFISSAVSCARLA